MQMFAILHDLDSAKSDLEELSGVSSPPSEIKQCLVCFAHRITTPDCGPQFTIKLNTYLDVMAIDNHGLAENFPAYSAYIKQVSHPSFGGLLYLLVYLCQFLCVSPPH